MRAVVAVVVEAFAEILQIVESEPSKNVRVVPHLDVAA